MKHIRISDGAHQQLRVMAAWAGKSMTDTLDAALAELKRLRSAAVTKPKSSKPR